MAILYNFLLFFREFIKSQLRTTIGKPIPNDTLIPKFSATKPSIGGASKNMRKDICANEATLTAAGLSVFWAAADIAKGNNTAEPPPIKVKPISEIITELDNVTANTPMNIM